jgi:sortase A
VENPKEALKVRITADAIQVEPLVVAPIVALPMLILILPMLLGGRKKR